VSSTVVAAPQGPLRRGEPEPGSEPRSVWRRWVGSAEAFGGGTVIFLVIALAVVSLFWTPDNPLAVDPAHALAGPSAAHLLGTDQYGRDVASRLMAGAQISLYAGFVSVLIAAVVGIPAGLLAAQRGGWVEEAVLRLADIVYAFPALLAAITLSAAIGASTLTAMIAIGIAYIPVFARVTRSNAVRVLHSEYVLAARSYGRGPWSVVRRHVLPNIRATIIVQMTQLFSLAILAEAALDFLGLGTVPPTPSWGNMLQTAQDYLGQDTLLSIWPGLAIFVTVLALNLLGDGLNEVLEPRWKR
jgi:peptide/nickel transport system permease protein